MSPPVEPRDIVLLRAALEHFADGGDGEIGIAPPLHVISEYVELRVHVRRDDLVPRLRFPSDRTP